VTDEAPHPEASCERCRRPNPVRFVDSDRYNTAVSRSEIDCPSCFVTAHGQATGMRAVWELRPTSFRWIEDEGRPAPFLTPRET